MQHPGPPVKRHPNRPRCATTSSGRVGSSGSTTRSRRIRPARPARAVFRMVIQRPTDGPGFDRLSTSEWPVRYGRSTCWTSTGSASTSWRRPRGWPAGRHHSIHARPRGGTAPGSPTPAAPSVHAAAGKGAPGVVAAGPALISATANRQTVQYRQSSHVAVQTPGLEGGIAMPGDTLACS